jgi:hypothetical protein
LDSHDNNGYSFPRISVPGTRQSSTEECFNGIIPDAYACLPNTLESIILSALAEFKPRNLSHIQPHNDDITSLPREGLDLARSFAGIKNPVMRQIILKLVMHIDALEK